MNLPPIKPHYQRFNVEIVTQQSPNKVSTIEVPARTAQEAVDSTVENPEGRYDWTKITCNDVTTERKPHLGGSRE